MVNVAAAQALFNAYRQGLLNKERPRTQDYFPRFQALLRQLLINQVPLAERLSVRRIWNASAQGLRLAREGCLGEAAVWLTSGWEEFDRVRPQRISHLMALSVLESAQAYLDARESRFDKARERLHSAMDADLALEHDGEFNLLEIHRIQSAQNLMRLELLMERPEAAYLLGATILCYLENLTDGLPVHHSWRREALIRVPRAVRRAMVTQVGNEMAISLSQRADASGWEKFNEPLKPQRNYFEGKQALHRPIQHWVQLKSAFQHKNWSLYLSLLQEFLPQGRKDIGPIWYSVVLDFAAFCRVSDSRALYKVRSGILRDSEKWHMTPSLRFSLIREKEEGSPSRR